MSARASIGVVGDAGIEEYELFRDLVSQVLPLDRLQWGPGTYDYTIVSGQRALSQYRPDLRPGETHGRALMVGDDIVFPVLHHESYRRYAPWRQDLLEELRVLRRIAVLRRDGDPWLDLVPISCVKCRGDLYRIDDQNVSYCETHWRSR